MQATADRPQWDFCLPADMSDSVRRALDTFRKHEWPRIAAELQHTYGVEPEDEPHWVGLGEARFWESYQQAERVEGTDEETSGGDRRGGWKLTDSVFAVRNAPTLVRYLKKGLRLRPPPPDGVEGELGVEAGVPPEAIPKPYVCRRHKGAVFRYTTWQAYIDHCNNWREPVNEKPPQEVLERLSSAPYACLQHNMAFANKARAEMHIRESLRGPGRPQHATLRQMVMAAD